MTHEREPCAVSVAGGLLAVGGARDEDVDPRENPLPLLPDCELFDEASGRWFTLPHQMAEPRDSVSAVSLPAAALVAAGP